MLKKWFSRWAQAVQEEVAEEPGEADQELASDDSAKVKVTFKPMPKPKDLGELTVYERDTETPPYRSKDRLFSRYPY